jgi:hypothetical protein
VLVLEEPCTRYPFKFLYVSKPSHSVWGDGFVQQLMPMQFELDALLNMVRNSMKLSGLKIGIPSTSNVNTMAIAGVPDALLKFTDQPPIPLLWPAVAPDVYQQMDRIWQRMFEVPGISQLSAQSQKPAGLNSGKALQVYADVQSQRFEPSYAEYQHFFLRLARQIIACARDMDESFYVRAAGKQTMSTVRWADVGGLEDHEFDLKLYPTNALADDPAARIQQVQDLMTAQLLDPKAGRRLLDMPDLEEFSSYENASYNLTMRVVTEILHEGRYIGPEPHMDLAEAVKLVQLAYVKARFENAPEDRLELLDRWMSAAQGILAPPPPPPGAGAPPGPPTPGAPGMPVPGRGGPLAPGRAPPPVQNSL